MSVYDFKVKAMDGSTVDLADYKGKVLLIINSATECGFTPQYPGLQELYSKYKDQGLEILDFPCNQFGEQAPGSDDDIHTFCTGRFGITFPQMSKIDVNGENADPLYKYLVSNTEFQGFDMNHDIGPVLDDMFKQQNPDYAKDPSIKWNFTKFLIGKDGEIVKRFEPTTTPEQLDAEISSVL